MRVAHVITDLDPDGAQTMLYRLLSRTDPAIFETEVISLRANGEMSPKIEALGIRVRSLGMSHGVPGPLAVLQLALLKMTEP